LSRYFTIGMAGHIDHGKTSLTKALTGVSTDSLKEEQIRRISIEPGFAQFIKEEDLEVSIIDVPGHENFIRQMIAGVAGIDLVTLVIAADEGIMPQTKEHLDILSLLGINKGIVVITKINQADEELLEIILDDIKKTLSDTFLKDAPLFLVDSLSQEGIPELKNALKEILVNMPKKQSNQPFRLPIDHVFTIKGQGTIARGTIYNGNVSIQQDLTLLPSDETVRVRQIQRHQEQAETAFEGQRAALNLGGVSHQDISRGDVLVENDFYSVTKRIDIAFQSLDSINHIIKQRQAIKLHIATQEVMGNIIFYDRNEISQTDTGIVLCQIQVNQPIVVARGDHFIVRRPTPTETIGGGWVIDPLASKHPFGPQTIKELKLKATGTPKDRLISLITEQSVLTKNEILKELAISDTEWEDLKTTLLKIDTEHYTLKSIIEQINKAVLALIKNYHEMFPMRQGINKAEILSDLKTTYPVILLEFTLDRLNHEDHIKIIEQYISLSNITPTLPNEWKKRLETIEEALINQGMEVIKWEDLIKPHNIPPTIQKEYYYYLLHTKRAYIFDEDRLISNKAVEKAYELLKEYTNAKAFTLQTAREALNLSRKNLVPLLELLDELNFTKRSDNTRFWL